MNIETFKSLKNSPEALILNKSIIELINMLSVGGRRTIKNFNRGGNQLLKNPKMQLLKDKIENKVNLCLNKLSEMNINNLLYEFIESMGRINLPEYLEIQKAFYIKMQADISFVKIYLEFFKIISNVYKDVFNFEPDFFYSIIETKFFIDYSSSPIIVPNELVFLNEYEDETKRINNLIILRTVLNILMLNTSTIQPIIDKLILEQTNYFTDIYYWFQNEKLTQPIKDKIKSIIFTNSLPLREKILLDNLIDEKLKVNTENNTVLAPKLIHNISPINTITPKTKTKHNDKIYTDTLKLETENILEEYLNLGIIDDIKEFIEDRCKDALTKNKFCQYIYDKYFETSTETSIKILDLIKVLIKKQILYKSNLSRGILLIYSNWNDISLDYNKPNKKMKDLLQCLKNMGITKYLESLLKTYKIEFNEQQTINI